MPKVSIYLPDSLYAEVRDRDLPVSTIAQRALEEAVRRANNGQWIADAGARALRTTAIDTAALLSDVRDEFGS